MLASNNENIQIHTADFTSNKINVKGGNLYNICHACLASSPGHSQYVEKIREPGDSTGVDSLATTDNP